MHRKTPIALGVILAHLAVIAVHGRAHSFLHISLTRPQQIFVFAVILVGPLLAGIVLLLKARRAGALLLLFSMAGSLVFGAYNHFVAGGADNALHMAPGPSVAVFQLTSILLFLVEAFGCWIGLAILRATAR